jgi:hypothetical protein
MTQYEVTETVTMYSDNGCYTDVEGIYQEGQYFDRNLNTFLQQGWKLLHLGQETDRTDEGGIWHRSVAIFGK